MIDQVRRNIFRMEIPLPNNPLKAVNSYVVKGPKRALIIDTGMNRSACKEAMRSGLDELGIDLNKTDFFITHIHADHLGLVSELVRPASTIYFGRPDADIRKIKNRKKKVSGLYVSNGFPEEDAKNAIKNHPGYKYNAGNDLRFHLIEEGTIIEIGGYRFFCIKTPGHTPGHTCLYEPDEKILFSGDHLLDTITPNITLMDYSYDSLSIYLKSLKKLFYFDISVVLPGHRSIFRNHRRRIVELQEHHERRAKEIIAILSGGDKDAYYIASKLTWDIEYKKWDQFPLMQKWFATGEAMAHLKYLENERKVKRKQHQNKTLFALL